jgi:hypothetical protein
MVKSLLPLALAGFGALLSGQPLEVRDAVGILEVANRSPIGLSPDGRWVAYAAEDLRWGKHVTPFFLWPCRSLQAPWKSARQAARAGPDRARPAM